MKFKKLLSVTLMAFLIAFLAACGNSESTEPENESQEPATEEKESATEEQVERRTSRSN